MQEASSSKTASSTDIMSHQDATWKIWQWASWCSQINAVGVLQLAHDKQMAGHLGKDKTAKQKY